MKTQIKILTIIIYITFSYQYSFSQMLEKGMTKEEVVKLWGKPDTIKLSEGRYKSHYDNEFYKNYKWVYGLDTILNFRNKRLEEIHYPFMNIYYKRKQKDTLSASKVFLFLFDTVTNKKINNIPGEGLIQRNNINNIKLSIFYKTPNSYQKIDSVEWVLLAYYGAGHEASKNNSLYFSKTQKGMINYNYNPLLYFIYVTKITLQSGQIIEYPIMENEKFIIHANNVIYKHYKTKNRAIDKLRELNKTKLEYVDCPEQPMLAYKLIK